MQQKVIGEWWGGFKKWQSNNRIDMKLLRHLRTNALERRHILFLRTFIKTNDNNFIPFIKPVIWVIKYEEKQRLNFQ